MSDVKCEELREKQRKAPVQNTNYFSNMKMKYKREVDKVKEKPKLREFVICKSASQEMLKKKITEVRNLDLEKESKNV